MADFNPIASYDIPQLLAGQALDGSLTPGSVKDTFLSPQGLAPRQRKLLSERVLEEDTNRFAKTAVGLATNPFVWALFLFGPVGEKALRAGARLTDVRKGMTLFARKEAGVLSSVKTHLDDLQGMASSNALVKASTDYTELMDRANAAFADADMKLMAAVEKRAGKKMRWHKESPFDPNMYPENWEERGVVQEISDYVFTKGHEFDVGGRRPVPQHKASYTVQVMERVKVGKKWVTRVKDELDHVPFDGRPEKFGVSQAGVQADWEQAKRLARELNEASKMAAATQGKKPETWLKVTPLAKRQEKGLRDVPRYVTPDQMKAWDAEMGPEVMEWAKTGTMEAKRSFVRALGKEDVFEKTGAFVIDRGKLTMAVSSFRSELATKGVDDGLDLANGNIQGKDLLKSIVEDFDNIVGRKVQSPADWDNLLNELGTAIDPGKSWNREVWLSRNTLKRGKVMHGNSGVYKEPEVGIHELDSDLADRVPWAYVNSQANKTFAPLTSKELMVDPDYLKRLESKFGYNPELVDEIKRIEDTIDSNYNTKYNSAGEKVHDAKNLSTLVLTPNVATSFRKYVMQTTQTHVLDTRGMKVGREIYKADQDMVPEVKDRTYRFRDKNFRVGDQLSDDWLARNQMSVTEIINRDFMGLQNDVTQSILKDSVGAAFGAAGPKYMALRATAMENKKRALWFANSMLGKAIEKHTGEGGKNFIERMRHLATSQGSATNLKSFSGGLANYLYTTHLGFNLGSVILNLTQPIILAAAIGRPVDVIGAFVDSMKEVFAFIGKRAQKGKLFLDPEEKLQMMRESFPLMGKESGGRNLLGIGPNMHAVLDHNLKGPGGPMEKLQRGSMGLFEISEWFNRNTTAHLVKRVYMRQTGAKSYGELRKTLPGIDSEVEQFVMRFQYGQHDLNQIRMFREGEGTLFNNVLANPLVRMFASFPIRTAYSTFGVMPNVGGEQYWEGLGKTLIRGMGYSAILHEMGRGLFGVDLSPGLFVGSQTALFGGDRMSSPDSSPVPIPPIAKIPWDLLRGVANEDDRLFSSAIARLFPGGVAMSRAWGMAPQGPSFLKNTQPTYVGWGDPLPTGEVPVYKNDGTLVGYEGRGAVLAKALGVDMGSWREQGELDGYIIKHGQEIASAKRRVMEAYYVNDSSKAEAIKKQFEKKYGIPLAISKQQFTAFIQSKERGRTERVLNRIPPEARHLFQGMTGEQPSMVGGTLDLGVKPADRQRVNSLTPEEVARLRAMVDAGVGPGGRGQAPPTAESFGGFTSF